MRINDKTEIFKESLLYEIKVGRYSPLDKLPSEQLLCERHQISRVTARRALAELEEEGIIERRPPVGTFVKEHAQEKIAKAGKKDTALSVVFVLPASQVENLLVQGVIKTCQRYLDKSAKLSVVFNNNSRPLSLNGREADVLVVHGIQVDEQLRKMRDQVGTLVLLNTLDEEFSYLTADNYRGGQIMAEHVISSGHRSLGCVGPGSRVKGGDFAQRYMGIEDYCREAGVKLESKILTLEDYEDLPQACDRALDMLMKKLPDMSVMLGLYDLIAIHLYESLNLRGMYIPNDMSVMGFDDQYFAEYTVPPLTTIKYPVEAIGIKLAHFIMDWTKDRKQEIHEVIEPLLVEYGRGSVKNLDK